MQRATSKLLDNHVELYNNRALWRTIIQGFLTRACADVAGRISFLISPEAQDRDKRISRSGSWIGKRWHARAYTRQMRGTWAAKWARRELTRVPSIIYVARWSRATNRLNFPRSRARKNTGCQFCLRVSFPAIPILLPRVYIGLKFIARRRRTVAARGDRKRRVLSNYFRRCARMKGWCMARLIARDLWVRCGGFGAAAPAATAAAGRRWNW